MKLLRTSALVLVMLLSSVLTASACEPLVQLVMIFAGPGMLSFFTLGAGVLVKCGIFAFLNHGLTRGEAFCHLFLGNLYTTAIGFLLLVCTTTIPFVLLVLPLTFALCWKPAKRIIEFSGWPWAAGRHPEFIAGGMTLLALLSLALFVSSDLAMGSKLFALYWLLKVGYAVCGLAVGFGLTALWEEFVVAKLAARRHAPKSYFTSVIRANYITFGLALLVMAVRILPQRLKSSHFLAWLAGTLN